MNYPQEGDYCSYHFVIIEKYKDELEPCNKCMIKCIHSKGENKDYLIKK